MAHEGMFEIRIHPSHSSSNTDGDLFSDKYALADTLYSSASEASSKVSSGASSTYLCASPPAPPNGGTTAWLQVVAGVFTNALTWGYATSFGVFQLYYVAHLNHDVSAISWIGTIQIFLLFFVAAFSGRATDANLTRSVVAIGSTLIVIGIFTASLATHYWSILIAQGICIGLGGGLIYMPVLTLIGTYFSTKKTFAVGTAAAGTGIGGLVFPAIIQFLLPKIGFGWAVRCMSFVSLLFAAIINICIKPRLPSRRSGSIIDWSALKEPSYTLFSGGVFLIFWALWVSFQYITLFAQTRIGLTDIQAFNLVLIMNAIGIPPRMALTYVADRWLGPINTMIPSAACLSICLFCWIAVETRSELYAFTVFCGFFAAATLGLFSGSLVSITDDMSRLGARMGLVFTLVSFASLTGGPLVGAIVISDDGNYDGAQIWLGSVALIGCLSIIASRLCKTGWILRTRA